MKIEDLLAETDWEAIEQQEEEDDYCEQQAEQDRIIAATVRRHRWMRILHEMRRPRWLH